MKKKLLLCFTLLLSFLFMFGIQSNINVKALSTTDGIPYETYTLGASNRIVLTQTAYVPYGILNKDVSLSSPKDIYNFNEQMYIADTNNKRIVIIGKDGSLIDTLEYSEFLEPTGIFVNNDYIYVTDKSAKEIFVFNHDKSLYKKYTKPTESIFGKNTPFVPIKITVNQSGLMYVIGEGSTNGVITINKYGEFMGFIGINSTTFSLRKYLYNFFVSGGSLARQTPSAPTNIAIGSNGNIYTTNAKTVAESFKRLNISGNNTLGSDTYYPSEEISDIAISDDNYTYISTVDGNIYEYDVNGKLLFKFNTLDTSNQNILGLTTRIDGIEVDNNGNIYALDSTKNNIQIYQRTAFVNVLHEAVDMYNDGKYLQSKELWEHVLKENNNFAFAHTALGWSYFKEDNYDAALNEFYLSKNYSGYSQVFWEIRNIYIQTYAGWFILGLVALIVLIKVLKIVLYHNAYVDENGKKIPMLVYNAKENYANKEHSMFTIKSVNLLKELKYSFHILRHPSDACYGIKKQHKASYLSGIVILILFVITYLLNLYGAAFLFRYHGSFTNVLSQIATILAIFALWCGSNYLIATLNDGEGWFKDIFITSCYCLLPYILIKLPLIPLSYCLTYNEQFIMSIANTITYAYCAILLLVSIGNIHNYSFKETIKNVVLTIIGMLIVAFTLLLVYMFMSQLIDFIISLIKEVFTRG